MKLHAPAAERNRAYILEVLDQALPARGNVLEIASGSGQHAAFFARNRPAWHWHPTDISPAALESIEAWRLESGLPNLRPPTRLDVRHHPWPVSGVEGVVCINLIHIAPWECTEHLFAGAANILAPGGPLVLYGPYRIPGEPTAPSNVEFDRRLREENPEWGVRDLSHVEAAAVDRGFRLSSCLPMPANNVSVVFTRA